MVNIGAMIGSRYEVIERVGAGGMANVYRAKDHRLNRFVAVKVLKNEYSEDTKFVTKFRQEARAIASLSHPNIVGVYDVGEEEGMYYIVMEFIDGITLKKYIEKKGKLSVRESVGISLQIASGLEAAHSNHIIHRDIKPQNILISRDGTAKVTDFGIAKAASSNTITANAMGSVHYISPEQARGGFSDEKSDIYSLGVSMYEMLSGTLPFTGENAVAVALAHIQEDAAPLAAIDATIPKGLSNIVAKCMQKKTELRYPTAADLIADLKMFLQDPSGEYGIIRPLYEESETIFIKSGDVDKIRAASGKLSADSIKEKNDKISDDESDHSEGDVDPKLEKALVIGSIAVACIIGIIVIYALGKLFGLWGGSKETTPTPTPAVVTDEATATPASSDSSTEGTTVVPALKNLTKDEAVAELEENKLQYKFSEKESDSVDAGKVISTNPKEGTSVAENTQVQVILSTGPKKVSVTNVTGYSQTDAENALENDGFTVKVGTSVFSDSVEEGKVAYTDPRANAKVLPNSSVTIYVSKGVEKQTTTVPDVIGMTQKEAKNELNANNLILGGVTKAYSDNVEKGCVCVQSKLEGTEVDQNTTVDVTISLGPEPSYSYVGSVTIDNPFEYESDPSASFKFVLSQDGKKKTIKTVELSYSDFPYQLTDVKGTSENEGDVLVYKDNTLWQTYSISFKRVAD